MDRTTTKKKQLLQAISDAGDNPDGLIAFFQRTEGKRYYFNDDREPPIVQGGLDDVPEREFGSGFGGTEGEPLIAFTKRFVYISCQYDGSEWVEAIPRNPEEVKTIPWVGGGLIIRMGDYYDKDGTRLELLEWTKKFEDNEYCRVGLDEREGIRVSTVWLGLDHNFAGGPPLIFETMVFDDQDTHETTMEGLPSRTFSNDLTQARYSTMEEAEAGHKEHVKHYLNIMDLGAS